MIDIIVIAIIAAIVACAAIYVYKAKKSGRRCIGCSSSGSCSAKSCGGCSCGCSCCGGNDESENEN